MAGVGELIAEDDLEELARAQDRDLVGGPRRPRLADAGSAGPLLVRGVVPRPHEAHVPTRHPSPADENPQHHELPHGLR